MTTQHYRDLSGWRAYGVPLASTASDEAARCFDRSLSEYIGWYADPLASAQQAIQADPQFVLGYVLSAGLELFGTTVSSRTEHIQKQLAQANALLDSIRPQDAQQALALSRERRHCKAITLFGQGNVTAAATVWEDILLDYPLDMLAIKFAHDSYFYQAYSKQIRDSIARVLPFWNKDMPGYGHLLGMYAFGLEEMGEYKKAEHMASAALEINPRDCWATHAKVHVYEMQAMAEQGIAFISSTVQDWEPGAALACHNYWHWALYHLERGEHDAALALYDNQVAPRAQSSSAPLDLVDASSLLCRLEFEGVNVGNRWKALLKAWMPHKDNHIIVFNDVHLLMAVLGAGETSHMLDEFFASLRRFARLDTTDQPDGNGPPNGNPGDDAEPMGENAYIARWPGVPLCEAVRAFGEKRYGDTVELLMSSTGHWWHMDGAGSSSRGCGAGRGGFGFGGPLRWHISNIGGSHAQRDVFALLLIHAALRSGEPRHLALAKRLLHERDAVRPGSSMTQRILEVANRALAAVRSTTQ